VSRTQRIKELLKLRENGSISSSEFDELLKILNDEEPPRTGADSPILDHLPPPDAQGRPASVGSEDAEAKLSTVVENGKGTRLRIVAVSTALLVAVAVFVLSRDRDPTESQEYKELLKKQAVVQDEISKIEAELNSLQQSIADSKNAHELQMESLNEKLENWQSVPDADNLLSLVRSLGA
jgi:hypothetical protein